MVARKAALKRLLRRVGKPGVRFTEHFEEQGELLFKKLEAMQVEGMVCKRKDSAYAFTRSRLWLKVKTWQAGVRCKNESRTGSD